MFTKEKMINKVKRWFYKDKYILLVSLIIGLMATSITAYSKVYSESIQTGLAQNLIRFHVIAHSDAVEDQTLKNAVRDAILEDLKEELRISPDIEQTRELLLASTDRIEAVAQDVISQWGKTYPVKASLGTAPFPTKRYGDVVIPAGSYEAMRVVIGDGCGKNWWCVMFPPMCFVDITHGTVPEKTKEELKHILTEEEYKLVVSAKSKDAIPIKVKFKIVEWWQERKLTPEVVFAKTKKP